MKAFLISGIFALALANSLASGLDGPRPLVWDSMEKAYAAGLGEHSARVVFAVRNESGQPITITGINPSCGCTTADSPPLPWVLAPGARGSVKVSVDLAGKRGDLTKTVEVDSSAGRQELTVAVHIPLPPPLPAGTRADNQRILLADRQAIFTNPKCAACHADGLADLEGARLFQSACGICHSSAHRASMVPDLSAPREPRDYAFWWKWIAEGREGSLMPAFSREHGGVLDKDQIWSLAMYGLETYPGKGAR